MKSIVILVASYNVIIFQWLKLEELEVTQIHMYNFTDSTLEKAVTQIEQTKKYMLSSEFERQKQLLSLERFDREVKSEQERLAQLQPIIDKLRFPALKPLMEHLLTKNPINFDFEIRVGGTTADYFHVFTF